jgi:hypothetical protein
MTQVARVSSALAAPNFEHQRLTDPVMVVMVVHISTLAGRTAPRFDPTDVSCKRARDRERDQQLHASRRSVSAIREAT